MSFTTTLLLICAATAGMGVSEKPVGYKVCQHGGGAENCAIVSENGYAHVPLTEKAIRGGKFTAQVYNLKGELVYFSPTSYEDKTKVLVNCL